MRKPLGIQKCDGRTDGRTDGPSDLPTDRHGKVQSRVSATKNDIEGEGKKSSNANYNHNLDYVKVNLFLPLWVSKTIVK